MIRYYLSLYKDFVLQYWKTLMASKVNFFLGLAAFLATQAGGVLFLVFVFQAIPNLNGWTLPQLMFIYGFAQLPRGIDHLFADYLWLFTNVTIVQGDYDRYLLRPLSPLFQVIAERFQGDALGEILVGIIILVIAVGQLALPFSLLNVALFIVLVFAGALIYTSIKLFFASLAFWIKDSFPLLNIAYMFADFAKYPENIYMRPVSVFLSFVLPFSFTAFIPASWFLGTGTWQWTILGTLVAALVSATIAGLTWKAGQKVYDSAGN